MRIVDLETLRALPEGTLFQKYKPAYFEGLAFLGDACGEKDFTACFWGDGPVKAHSTEGFFGCCDEMAEQGASHPVDLESYGRDGCFDGEQLFAIWEPDDVRALVEKLQALI